MFLLTQKSKIIGSITTNTAFVLFIASLGVLTAFVAMIYFDKNNQVEKSSDSSPSPLSTLVTTGTADSTTSAINNLTSQLMTERQLTDELHSQNENLKYQLKKKASGGNSSDYKSENNYLSAIEALNNKKVSKVQNKKMETTDYYNKVSLNTNSQNLLQNQINQFIDSKDKAQTIYLESLKVESKVRNNEVRSIALKKGESIWMLAKRAYGSGFKYHKIMKANPQITEKNAKYLKIGTIIRVPF
jgi:hypothetical protein